MQLAPDLLAQRTASGDFDTARVLRRANVLVVEDEAILALDLASTLSEAGAMVAGPLRRLRDAMAYTDLDGLDAAVLDVDIAGEEVFRFADRLIARDVPIVFHTGRVDVADLSDRYPQARILRKPCPSHGLIRALTSAILRCGIGPRAAS